MPRLAKFYLGCLFFSVLYLAATLNLNLGTFSVPKSGFFPLFVSIVLIASSFCLFINAYKHPETSEGIGHFPKFTIMLRAGYVLVALIIYALCFEPIGFVICTSFILFFLFYLVKSGSFIKITILTICTVIGTYIIFDYLLDIPLPAGILEGIIL